MCNMFLAPTHSFNYSFYSNFCLQLTCHSVWLQHFNFALKHLSSFCENNSQPHYPPHFWIAHDVWPCYQFRHISDHSNGGVWRGLYLVSSLRTSLSTQKSRQEGQNRHQLYTPRRANNRERTYNHSRERKKDGRQWCQRAGHGKCLNQSIISS